MSSPLTGAPRHRELYGRVEPAAAWGGAAQSAAAPARRLCVTVHGTSEAPARRADRPGERIVLCPPLAEELGHARTALHRLAARLAAAGHRAIVYDPCGHGDSEGDFSEVTIGSLLADLACVASHPALGGDATAVIGFRFGAAVAAHAIAAELVRPARLVLVDPILRGAPYARALLLKNVAAQIAERGSVRRDVDQLQAALAAGSAVEVDGHALAPALYDGLLRTDGVAALTGARASRVSVDVIALHARTPRPSAEILDLVRLRPAVVHRIEALEPWKEDQRHVISDVPLLADRLIAALAEDPRPTAAGDVDG